MEAFVTKQEGKLFRALELLLHNSVDAIGLPKKATAKQLHKAQQALFDYENYARKVHKA
jgi:hypothetical protein